MKPAFVALCAVVATQHGGTLAAHRMQDAHSATLPLRQRRRASSAPSLARRRALSGALDDPQVIAQTFGCSSKGDCDAYYVDLTFTNSDGAMQTYPMLVDTGSSNLAVAVAKCTNCGAGHATQLTLNEDASKEIGVVYGESGDITSWSGVLATSDTGIFAEDSGATTLDDTASALDVTNGEAHATVELAAITSQDSFFGDGDFAGIWGLA